MPWRRNWHPTPVFLPGKSQRQRSLAGYSPRGRKEADTTEPLIAQALPEKVGHLGLFTGSRPSAKMNSKTNTLVVLLFYLSWELLISAVNGKKTYMIFHYYRHMHISVLCWVATRQKAHSKTIIKILNAQNLLCVVTWQSSIPFLMIIFITKVSLATFKDSARKYYFRLWDKTGLHNLNKSSVSTKKIICRNWYLSCYCTEFFTVFVFTFSKSGPLISHY